jgi:hypothetical protein
MLRKTLVAVLAAALTTPATVAAAPATEISLSESIVFPGNAPPHGTFTAAGLPGCSSGTLVDDLKSFNASFTHILVERTYACDGGIASFTALLVLTIEPGTAPGTEAVSGRWIVSRGEGALGGLRGAGVTQGQNAGGSGAGTVEALVHLG